jgi:hypothetical protein
MDAYRHSFMAAQQQQQFWFNYQYHQHQLMQQQQQRRRRLLIAILLQREQRAMHIFNTIEAHRDRTRNDPRPEWHAGQDGQRQLDWFVPQPRPGDGLGDDDDLLRGFVGGFIPRHGGEEVVPEAETPARGDGEIPRRQGDELPVLSPGGEGPRQGIDEQTVPTAGNASGGGQSRSLNPFDFELSRWSDIKRLAWTSAVWQSNLEVNLPQGPSISRSTWWILGGYFLLLRT